MFRRDGIIVVADRFTSPIGRGRPSEARAGEGLRSHLELVPLTRRAGAPTSPRRGEVKERALRPSHRNML